MECTSDFGLGHGDQLSSSLGELNEVHYNSVLRNPPRVQPPTEGTEEVPGQVNGGLRTCSRMNLLDERNELHHHGTCDPERFGLPGPVQIYGPGSLHLSAGGCGSSGLFEFSGWTSSTDGVQDIGTQSIHYYQWLRNQGLVEQSITAHACHTPFPLLHPYPPLPRAGEAYCPPPYVEQLSESPGSAELVTEEGRAVLSQTALLGSPSPVGPELSTSPIPPGPSVTAGSGSALSSQINAEARENHRYLGETGHVASSDPQSRGEVYSDCRVSSLDHLQHHPGREQPAPGDQVADRDSKDTALEPQGTTLQPPPVRKKVEDPGARKRRLNAVAAQKFRVRKMETLAFYKEKEQDLREQYGGLVEQHSWLMNERHGLLQEIFAHAGCGHPMVDRFIQEKAAKIVSE